MVVFQSEPFYRNPPLPFRGLLDTLAMHNLEASECCFIYTDNNLSGIEGVWVNPGVRLGYNAKAYGKVNPRNG